MRKTKSLIALLLAFVMVLGAVSFAFAEDENSPVNESEETVTDLTNREEESENSPVADVTEGETPSEELSSEITEESEKEIMITDPVPGAKKNPLKELPIIKQIYQNGIPVITTSKFFKIFDALRMVKYVLTGKIIGKQPSDFEVNVDETLSDLFKDIDEMSGLDVEQILTNLPDDILEPGKIAVKVFHIDTKEYRDEMYALRDKYRAEGNTAKANICWLVGVYMGNLSKADIHLEPMPDKDYYRIRLEVTYADGGTESFYPNIYIDLNTGECFGLNDKGMLSIGFNSNIYKGMVYAPINCWMRNFGFCLEYDLLCYALPIYNYNTRRFHFEYNNKQYMIQCWKGNYLITTGGEVGIYYRDKGKVGSYYDVVKAEDQMDMSLQIIHGDDVLVDVPEQNHWWVNGFKLLPVFYLPGSLTMKFTIVMKDEEMLKAFTRSIDRNAWHDVTYKTDGLKIYVEWDG